MPEVICNTSPFQYLHWLGQLELLPTLVKHVLVPPAVVSELATGRALGLDLPDPAGLSWVTVQRPASSPVLPLLAELGAGEAEVLALALEIPGAIAILDDGLARRVATSQRIPLTGTLGLLLDGKKAGLIPSIAPLLTRLNELSFRVSPATQQAVLKLANE